MIEIGEALSSVRERASCGDHILCFSGFNAAIGAHSISEEVAGFSPLWFPRGKFPTSCGELGLLDTPRDVGSSK